MIRTVLVSSLRSTTLGRRSPSISCLSTFTPATRKRTSSPPTDSETATVATPLSVDFDAEIEAIKKKAETAVQSLVSLNKGFKISRGENGELIIFTGRGNHVLQANAKERTLVLQSYFSGYHNYFFDEEQRLWLSIKDGHDFRGLLTRDLMRHCNGCPQF